MPRRNAVWMSLVGILVLSALLVACGQAAAPAPTAKPAAPAAQPAAPAAAPASALKPGFPDKNITFVAPSAPGSGFDTTARAVVAALEKEKMINVSLPVQNASGSVEGFNIIVQQHKNDPYMVAIGSLSPLLNYASGTSPYSQKDFTPVSGLIQGYYGVFVHEDSKYKTLKEFLDDLKNNPEQTPMSGGSSDDRIFYGVMAMEYGADLKKINYAAYSGGTEASTVLLEGSVAAEITSIDDIMGLIEAKKVRLLAVSGSKRLGGVLADVPTLKEAGLNLEWVNTRYVIGGPGMPDYAKAYWQDTIGKMVKTPTWQETLQKYRWVDDYQAEGFADRLDTIAEKINKVAGELGLKKS